MGEPPLGALTLEGAWIEPQEIFATVADRLHGGLDLLNLSQ